MALQTSSNSLGAVVLGLISVLNETCLWRPYSRSLSKNLDLFPPLYFSLPFIYLFIVYVCVWLAWCTFSFLHKILAFFISPPLPALHMHLVSLKLCGFTCFPSSKHGFTYQASEQRTQHCIALIQQTYADIFFFYFNKHDSAVVPDQIVDFQQTQIIRFLYVYRCGTRLLLHAVYTHFSVNKETSGPFVAIWMFMSNE